MPQSEPITILVVNEHAEEVKLVTISLRGFFPGCRVEAVYSADEALEWVTKTEWHLILVDEELAARNGLSLLSELRRQAPAAAIIVQSDHTDSTSALHAMRAGADFFFYKKSPAFLTELLFYAREALEKRDLHLQLETTRERHQRLVDTLPDIIYELDPEGRFTYVSPTVTSVLGYDPGELTGTHYSHLLPPDQRTLAEHRFNDRRAGTRSTRSVELLFLAKGSRGTAEPSVPAEIHAKGLYDSRRRFLGTVGLVRDLSRIKQQGDQLHQLELQRQETDRLLALAQRLTSMSRDLQGPLSTLLAESQQLLSAVRELGLEPKLEAMTSRAAQAVELSQELSRGIRAQPVHYIPLSVNDQLNHVLDAEAARLEAAAITLDRQLATDLPAIVGNEEALRKAYQLFIHFIVERVSMLPGRRFLRVVTRLSQPATSPAAMPPTLFPLAPIARIEVELVGGSAAGEPPVIPVGTFSRVSSELLQAYRIVQDHGGIVVVEDSVTGPVRIVLQLIAEEVPPPLQAKPSIREQEISPAAVQEISPPTRPPELQPIERRQSPRVQTALPIRLTTSRAAWDGTVVNLSEGGALLSFAAPLTGLDNQPVQLLWRTTVSTLELQGILKKRPAEAGLVPPDQQVTKLAVQLTPPPPVERAVLASMIQAVRQGMFDVTIEAVVATQEPAEPEPGAPLLEQRQDLRLKLALPAGVELIDASAESNRTLGLTVNLSRSGACLHLQGHPPTVESRTRLTFTPSSPLAYHTTGVVPAPSLSFSGQVVWVTPAPSVSAALPPGSSPVTLRVGLRFQNLGQQEEHALNRLLSQHLASDIELEEAGERTVVVSRSLECRNAHGQRLALTEDHACRPVGAGTPVMLLAPGFGRTKTDEIELAYGLAANGLRVLRYDAANHVGLSDGEMQRTTLSGLQDDMTSVLNFVRQRWPLAPVLVAASDLAARVALKVATQQRDVRAWLLLNAVVDVQATLATVHRHDFMTDHTSGIRRGVVNLLGFNVDLDHFMRDLVVAGYADLAATIRDVGSVRSPSLFLSDRRAGTPSDRQPWTSPELVRQVLTALEAHGELLSAEQDREQQTASATETPRWLLSTILKRCRQILPSLSTTTVDQEAPIREMARQFLLERECVRAHHDVSAQARRALWDTHGQHASSLAEANAHWQLLDHLYRRLSPLDPTDVILDVGCGPGEVPRLILMNQAYRSQHRPRQLGYAPHYLGLGAPRHLLDTAEAAFNSFLQELDRDLGGAITAHPPLLADWIWTNWRERLPIADHRCARVVSVLSLNFADHPLTSLREMMRTLLPGGRLIVACMTHDTDLSGIYRRHLQRAGQSELAEPNRALLLYLGWLRQASCEGLVHTFDHDVLTRLLLQSGALRPRLSRLMGGHLLLAVAEKPSSPS